jgi:hypothetical protein
MDTRCHDCRVETLPVDDRRPEFYMVRDEVWTAVGMAPLDNRTLCVGCIEPRLGRRHEAVEFMGISIRALCPQHMADVKQEAEGAK